MKNGSDPLVVRTEDLRKVFEPMIDEDGGSVNPICKLLGVDSRNFLKKIYHQEFVTLTVADAWLTRLNLGYLIDNGTVVAIPNPRWTQESWMAWHAEQGCEPWE